MLHSKGCTYALVVLAWFACSASAQKIVPSPLLAIDQNRSTVVVRIVNQWGDALAASNAGIGAAELREMLNAMRADQLFAASLAGTLDGLRDVVANALTINSGVKGSLMHPKALGDVNDDVVYTPVTPCRILDTRNGTVPPYNAQMVGGVVFPVAANLSNFAPQGGSVSNCNLPASFKAVAVTLTVLNPNFDAFLAASDSSDFATLTRSVVMDFSANKGLVNTAIVPVDGSVKFYLGMPAQLTTHVIADVLGYFSAPHGSGNYFVQGGNALGSTAMLGTTDNQALEIGVDGMRVMRYEPNATSPNVIGGHDLNSAAAFAGQTVSGGGQGTSNCYDPVTGLFTRSCNNHAAADFATIGGGEGNLVTASFGAVGGGDSNTAGLFGTTAGGERNNASGQDSSIGGGLQNTASGFLSTVAGGLGNVAMGYASTVAGGDENVAGADHSFAAGHRAKATTTGSFIWADLRDFDFGPSVGNFFGVRATGGVGFTVAINPTTGAVTQFCNLLPGVPSWQCTSDHDAKENFVAADGKEIVERLATMPLFSWNLKGSDPAIRSLGPTAQDFYAAFGLGGDDKTIAGVNIEGVALAAIQGLYDLLQEKDARIAALERRLADLEALSRSRN